MAEKILKQYKFINLAFGTSNLHRFPELLYRTLNTDRNTVVVEDQDVIPEGLPISRARKEALRRATTSRQCRRSMVRTSRLI